MNSPARIRINEHRLVREESTPVHEVRVADRRETVTTNTLYKRRTLRFRSVLHIAVFFFAFIFTTGVLVLSVLLWVRPDKPASLVFVGLFAGIVFVLSFAALRFLSLAHLFPDTHAQETGEEDHHIAKSVAYGFVALVFALLLAGILINIASAFTL